MNLHSSPTTCYYLTFLYRVVENTLQITAAAAEYPINISLELSNESDTHVSFLSGQTRVTLKIPLDVVTNNLHVCMWRNKSQSNGAHQQETFLTTATFAHTSVQLCNDVRLKPDWTAVVQSIIPDTLVYTFHTLGFNSSNNNNNNNVRIRPNIGQ